MLAGALDADAVLATESVDALAQRVALPLRRLVQTTNVRMPRDGSLRCVPLLPSSELWAEAMHTMLGMSRAIGEAEAHASEWPALQDALPAAVFDARSSLALAREERAWHGGRSYRCDWHVSDCAPLVFWRLRQLYASARTASDAPPPRISLSPASLVHGVLFRAQWLGLAGAATSGRSGSSFWRSGDEMYVLKSLPLGEEALLRRMLPHWLQHVARAAEAAREQPRACVPSLLTQFCGLVHFRPSTAHQHGGTRCYVLMRSVFGRAVEQQYDLKGSSVNRRVGRAADGDVARKDSDFGDAERRRVVLGARRRAILLAQVERDVRFLEQFGLTDFSLLLGVRRADAADRRAGAVLADGERLSCGGWLGDDGAEVYYMAIIDVLTQYNLKKRGEHVIKSLRFDKEKISAQPPAPYRERFINFLSRIWV